MIKTSIFICFSGFMDEEIELITTDFEIAVDLVNKSKKLIDLREYEIEIDPHCFTRPEIPDYLMWNKK